jgi:hypothetical protein
MMPWLFLVLPTFLVDAGALPGKAGSVLSMKNLNGQGR